MSGLPFAWLAAFTAWLGWPIGSMALLMIHALTGGRWGVALRPALRAGVWSLPLALPGFLGVVWWLPTLYPWAVPGAHPANGFYLNPPFFLVRVGAYVAIWAVLAVLVLRDRGLAGVAGAGLFVLALSYTFASIDLTMSLEPRFNSTIWGMLSGSEAVLLALAVAAMMRAEAAGTALEDVAKLLLGVVILWTYLDFMQLVIIWQSDLPSDAPWYVVRSTGYWGVAMGSVLVLRFVVPFAVLITRLRRRAGVVAAVAALVAATQVSRAWWLVLPASGREPGVPDILAMVAFAAVGWAVLRRARPAGVAHG